MTVNRRMFLGMAAIPTLAGCASSSAPQTYALSAPADFPSRGGGMRGQLLVIEPKAIASLDTERIAVRQASGAISYLSDGAWADRLPRLLQARMIQAFENANRLRSVGRPGDRLASDWQLLTDIRAFELAVGGASEAQVELSVKLVNDRSGRILAAQVFSAKANAAGLEAARVTQAFDAVLRQVLREVVVWTTTRV